MGYRNAENTIKTIRGEMPETGRTASGETIEIEWAVEDESGTTTKVCETMLEAVKSVQSGGALRMWPKGAAPRHNVYD